jgi:hypothetical protein
MNSKFFSTQQITQYINNGSVFLESPDSTTNLLVLFTPKRFFETPGIEHLLPPISLDKLRNHGTKTVEVQY